MRHWHQMMAIGLLAVAAACGGKETTAVPPDTTVTPPPPPGPPPPPPAGQAVTIFAAGNISTCGTTRDEAVARLVDSTGTVFAVGDMAFPNGRAQDFANCYDLAWGSFKARTYATFGNHEYDSSATAEFAATYFGSRAGTNGKAYYSFDLGAWHVVVLNTGNRNHVDYAGGSEQLSWLAADLAASKAKCTLAIYHDGRFMSSTVAGFTERPMLASLWTILFNAGVDLVINANQHHFERFAPMDATGARDDARGIVSFNSGVGGESAQTPTAINANSAAITTDYGILKVVLRADSFDYQFLPIPGGTFTDAGSATCH